MIFLSLLTRWIGDISRMKSTSRSGLVLLFLSAAVSAVDLPRPNDIPSPPAGVSSPGGPALPAWTTDAKGSAAISAISETTFPDETLVMTGKGLAGARFVAWAEGKLFRADTIRSRDNRAQALIPPSVSAERLISGPSGTTPRSCMLVWPCDAQDNYGRPIRVNGPEAWWMWPAYRYQNNANRTIRVFGKNLSLDSVESGPVLVLAPESGAWRKLEVTAHNPYELQGTLPENLSPGRYRVRAHNGTGGECGWSETVTFEIREALETSDHVFAADSFDGTDERKITAAVDAAVEAGGGTVKLSARTYTITQTLRIRGKGKPLRIVGAGVPTYDPHTETIKGNGTIIDGIPTGGKWYRGRFVTIESPGCSIKNILLHDNTDSPGRTLYIEGAGFRADSCVLISLGPGEGPLTMRCPGIAQIEIVNCDLYTKSLGFHMTNGNGDFIRMARCRVFGSFCEGRGTGADGIVNRGSNNVIVEHCRFQSVDKQNAKLLSRTYNMYRSTIRNQYVAHNRSINTGSHPSVPKIDPNMSEQYLFHSRGDFKHNCSTVDAQSDRITLSTGVTVPEAAIRDRNICIAVREGRGVGQFRVVDRIIGATGTSVTLRLSEPWRVIPDSTSVVLFSEAFRHCVIYGNHVDCEPDPSLRPPHKRVGVYLFHYCFENCIEANTFRNLGTGVALHCVPESANGWNLVRGNRFDNMFGRTMYTTKYPVFYTDHIADYRTVTVDDRWLSFCNIFRGNTADKSDMAALIGFKQFDALDGSYWGRQPEGGIVMSVVENNRMTGTQRPVCLTATANWALVRNNVLSLQKQVLYRDKESTFECLEREDVAANAHLPAPTDVPAGPAVIEGPGGNALPALSVGVRPAAPAIAAISDVTFPDETLVITGVGLAGTRLRVWAEGTLRDIEPLRAVDNRVQAVVPGDMPPSTMLVWPVKGESSGAPIRVNGATIRWVWPARVEAGRPGSTVRVFGKNLCLPNKAEPLLVLIDPAGHARRLPARSPNPYSLEAPLPHDLAPGTFRVQAHNGTGGRYGWSETATFEVIEPRAVPDAVFRVDDYLDAAEGSDRKAIVLAVAAAAAKGGGTVRFAARHYRDVVGVSKKRETIELPEGVPIVLRGAGMGDYDRHADPNAITGTGTLISSAATHTRHPVFALHGRGQRVEDLTLLVRGKARASGPDMQQRISGVNLNGPDQKILRTRLIRSQHCRHWLVLSVCRGAGNNEILDCEFYHAAKGIRIMPGCHFTRIADCRMRGHYSRGRSTDANAVVCDGNHLILENCDFAGLDKTGGRILGRTFLSGNGYTSLSYFAGNRSVNVGSHSSVPGIDANTSEQYLFHVGNRDGGMFRVVRAGPDRLVLEDAAADVLARSVVTKPWRTTMDRAGKRRDGDWAVFVAGGRGVGQWRLLVPGAAGVDIRVRAPWRVVPDRTSTVIMQRVFHNNIIVNNTINPSPDPAEAEDHKTVGVFWWVNCFENITAGNTVENTGVGVGLTVFSGSKRGDCAAAWNLTRDNVFRNMIGGTGDAAPVPVFYSDHHIGNGWHGLEEDFDHWRTVGNIFRANHCEKSAAALAHHGWMRFDEIGVGHHRRGTFEEHGHRINYRRGPEKGMVMSVIENNVMTGGRRGILLSAPANWTLVRNNTLELRDPDAPVIEYYGREQVQDAAVLPPGPGK